MERFVNSPELIERMGLASRRLAETNYDVLKINDFMLSEMGIEPKGCVGSPAEGDER